MSLPNGPLQIVFSFDTTGSMSGYLGEVRGRVSDMVQRLQADIPGIQLAIFAHGDYCDTDKYVTKYIDFTDDVGKLCSFVKDVESTYGGDADECYELVLHEVRTKLSWQPGTQRALVMIGDADPHGPNYPGNKLKLNWRNEAKALGDIGVKIYGVDCSSGTDFYKTISEMTAGRRLKLTDFKQVFDLLMAVCYNEKGCDFVNMYEKEVRARGGPVHADLNKVFSDLRADSVLPHSGPVTTYTPTPKPKLTKPSSFLSLKTTTRVAIRDIKPKIKRKSMPSKLSEYKLENLPKLKREDVPEKNFLLNNKAWSKWQLVISPTTTDACDQTRPGIKAGYRSKTVFSGKTNKPALYEIAVQPKSRCRKFVVYSKSCRKGFQGTCGWERKLLGKKDIRTQIDNVVKKGCSVFVRRVLLKAGKIESSTKQSLKLYDYAWSKTKDHRHTHRQVTKAHVDISEKMDIDI